MIKRRIHLYCFKPALPYGFERPGRCPEKMNHGNITNQRKAAFREKQDSKKHKISSINFNIEYGQPPESMVNSYPE